MLPSVWFLSAPGSDLKGKGREVHISDAVVVVTAPHFWPSSLFICPLFSLVWRGVVLGTE